MPQVSAYTGDICRLDALWTKAIAALLTIPLVAGDTTPNTRINIEKNRPNLCLRSVTKAIKAAHVCTNIDEYKLQMNMWYHISANVLSMITSVAAACFGIGSSTIIVFILLSSLLTRCMQMMIFCSLSRYGMNEPSFRMWFLS